MKQSVLDVTKEFSEWANEICHRFAGPGMWQPNDCPMTGNELAIGLMEFVKAHRYTGTIDCLAIECDKVVKERGERATRRKNARTLRNQDLNEKRPSRERYNIATSREFKDWLDSGRKGLVGLGIRPLTIKEYTDALMAFVAALRHSNGEDRFDNICKKLVNDREERWELCEVEKMAAHFGPDLATEEIHRILRPEFQRKRRNRLRLHRQNPTND